MVSIFAGTVESHGLSKSSLGRQGAGFDNDKIKENREQDQSDCEKNQKSHGVGGIRNGALDFLVFYFPSVFSFCHVVDTKSIKI